MRNVLTIEDDAETASEIAAELGNHGFSVECASTGREGLVRAVAAKHDIITLDRMLPDLDGLAVVKALREVGVQTPVLMISALSDVDERVRGLRAGGDDYLTKPFDPNELTARVEVLLRRQFTTVATTVLKVGDLELNRLTRIARRGTRELSLQPTEYKLLEYMMSNAGQVLTRMMIFEAVWDLHFDPGTNLVNVHVWRLRQKIDPPGETPLIHTVRGSGYVLDETR